MRILIARIYIVNVFRTGRRFAADGDTALGGRIPVNVSEKEKGSRLFIFLAVWRDGMYWVSNKIGVTPFHPFWLELSIMSPELRNSSELLMSPELHVSPELHEPFSTWQLHHPWSMESLLLNLTLLSLGLRCFAQRSVHFNFTVTKNVALE